MIYRHIKCGQHYLEYLYKFRVYLTVPEISLLRINLTKIIAGTITTSNKVFIIALFVNCSKIEVSWLYFTQGIFYPWNYIFSVPLFFFMTLFSKDSWIWALLFKIFSGFLQRGGRVLITIRSIAFLWSVLQNILNCFAKAA